MKVLKTKRESGDAWFTCVGGDKDKYIFKHCAGSNNVHEIDWEGVQFLLDVHGIKDITILEDA